MTEYTQPNTQLDTIPRLAGAVFILTNVVGRLVAAQPEPNAMIDAIGTLIEELRDGLDAARADGNNAATAWQEGLITGAELIGHEIGSAISDAERDM